MKAKDYVNDKKVTRVMVQGVWFDVQPGSFFRNGGNVFFRNAVHGLLYGPESNLSLLSQADPAEPLDEEASS